MELGYCKVVLDEKSIQAAMLTKDSMDEIAEYVTVDVTKDVIPSKLKVNFKRTSSNQTTELLKQVA